MCIRDRFRVDSEFENVNAAQFKVFAARYNHMFTDSKNLPSPEPFTSSDKTYPSYKMRCEEQSCNKG